MNFLKNTSSMKARRLKRKNNIWTKANNSKRKKNIWAKAKNSKKKRNIWAKAKNSKMKTSTLEKVKISKKIYWKAKLKNSMMKYPILLKNSVLIQNMQIRRMTGRYRMMMTMAWTSFQQQLLLAGKRQRK